MKRHNRIKYLRVGSILLNLHSKKRVKIVKKCQYGFTLQTEGESLYTTELKDDMGLYFKKLSK